jgi:hypothetical protein
MKTRKYRIEKNGKTISKIYKGVDTAEAFKKYANAKFFNNDNSDAQFASLKQIDADTRGQEWAQYYNSNEQIEFIVSVIK